MYLVRLYSEPPGLFETIEFKNGVNIIYGKKDIENSPLSSLNSIGKSTALDLIDFCLLSAFSASHNPRLFSAKDLMTGYNIVLEFSINETIYLLKRNVDDKKILFGIDELKEYEITELKNILGDLIFYRAKYDGVFYSKWYRNLIKFYLKIQKFKRDQYNDPIKYLKDQNEIEVNVYQLYLLGLDNRLTFELYKFRTDLRKLTPAIGEIEKLLSEKYGLNDISEVNKNINKLKYEITKLETSIGNFQLNEEYVDAEKEANILTQEIKEKWFQNFSDRNKIDAYTESFNIPESISTTKIKNIYKELSENFATLVKKTLDDAVKFRKQLSENRRLFLQQEIDSLKTKIEERENEIIELEKERVKYFNFLSAKEAIKDLTEAFGIVSDKKNKLSELEASTKLLNDLLSEKKEIEEELAKIDTQIFIFVSEINNNISELYNLFTEIYNHIYINNRDESGFSIDYVGKKDKKIDIDISMPDMYGKGKNQGRTLVYDIFLLLNSFKFENSFPRFIVHDGIFDGVDKAHFIAVYEYIEELARTGTKIQYITTINEEGTLTEKFGNVDKVTPEKLEEESILLLSPSKKLFGSDFSKIM